MAMEINLGQHVFTADGHDIGKIDKLIVRPDENDVERIVVRKGELLHRDVEVPRDLLRVDEDGRLVLTITSDHVHDLEPFNEANYTTPPAEYLTAGETTYDASGLLIAGGGVSPAIVAG